MSIVTALPGSTLTSPTPENPFVQAGDVHVTQREWKQALACYNSALEQSGSCVEQEQVILEKAASAFEQLKQQVHREAHATIATCEAALKGRALMRSEVVADLVQQKALAHLQVHEIEETAKTCNVSLRGPFRDIPYATQEEIRSIQAEAANTQIAAEGLVALSHPGV